ncbi:MAG: hypothetical protein IPP55_09520 [Anaerolineales bacterium]|nr:hypothetical protein [Anaerolineales bacterium]
MPRGTTKNLAEINSASPGRPSASAQTARNIQNQRFANSTDIVCNADMRIGEVRQFCQLQPEGQSLMRAAMSQLNPGRQEPITASSNYSAPSQICEQ